MLRTLLHRLQFTQRRKRTIDVSTKLGRSINELAQNEDRPPGDLINALLETGLEHWNFTEDMRERWGSLTRREREVAILLLQDLKYEQIADCLTISVQTVKTHAHRILEKFGVHSARALRHTILTSGILERKSERRVAYEDDEYRLKI